jgi:hypothetical protein
MLGACDHLFPDIRRVRPCPRNTNLRRPSGIRAGDSISPQRDSGHAKGIERRHLKYAMLRTLQAADIMGIRARVVYSCIRANGGSQINLLEFE